MTLKRVSLKSLQWRLLALWGGVTVVAFMGGFLPALASHDTVVWSWFTATVIPPLALASAAVASSEDQSSAQSVSGTFGLASTVVLSAYGAVVLFTMYGNGLANGAVEAWFTKSGLWLGPLQGVSNIFLARAFPGQKAPKSGPVAEE